jgi:hypothetical protein
MDKLLIICQWNSCKLEIDGRYLYCSKHTCEVRDCRSGKWKEDVRGCYSHGCKYLGCKKLGNECGHGCPEETSSIYGTEFCMRDCFAGSNFCWYHMCIQFSVTTLKMCSNSRSKCMIHKCAAQNCSHSRLCDREKYCQYHICGIDGCHGQKEYCRQHRCACDRVKYLEYDSCGVHLKYKEIIDRMSYDSSLYVSVLPRDIVNILEEYV